MIPRQFIRSVFGLGCLSAVLLAAAPHAASAKNIVVFAPHPDDEALIASGVIHRAKMNGDTIKVVLATSGDCKLPAYPHVRQLETMAAMRLLGLADDDVIFLGYPDCGLRQLYFSYTSPTSQFTSTAGMSQTYGFEGLGRTDYHTYIYGAPGKYNKPTMLQDIRTVLLNYRPQDVYTTSGYDDLNDHHALGFFVTEALVALTREDPTFQPTLHEALVHEPCEMVCDPGYHWPMPAFTPTDDMHMPPFLAMTPLSWTEAERVVVPEVMQSTDPAVNLKYRAIGEYVSQGRDWLWSFVKRDEVFWKSELWANLALKATATASSGLPGAAANRVNDGSVSGAPRNAEGEWVSSGQLAGAWVRLTWPAARTVTRIVLHDRPNTTDNVEQGTLTFSDGSTIPVGALPTNGVGFAVEFAAKTVTWVQFTVGGASGSNVGLAELEVYGPPTEKLPPQTPTPNTAPTLVSGPTPAQASISDVESTDITVEAADAEGDPLTYTWTSGSSTLTGAGPVVTFTPPLVSEPTTFRVDVTVADGRGGSVDGGVDITVSPSGLPANIAPYATVTVSSQAASQPGVRAIDGVVDGYPGDAQREWATVQQLAGAWIQLTWGSAQTITRAVLHDRINTTDQILAGRLVFSDGSSINFGTLPDNGTALTISFAARTVTWVRLEVTSARGYSTGLAELEVIRAGAPGSNHAPVITSSGPDASPAAITDIQSSTITVTASDVDGDALSYAWEANGGAVNGSGTTVTFTPPRVTVTTTFRVTVQVADDWGGATTGFVDITVTPSGAPLNLAPSATATASSENTARNQQAIKALDGVVDGFPNDGTKEWATVSQVAGAWIQLTWPSAQTIYRVVLNDRINTTDQILAGVLRFSDGSSVPVGALPDAGGPLTVSFASRSVTSVRLEVTSGRGSSVGLAEMSVFATPPAGSNTPPQIVSGPLASPTSINDLQSATISVNATDAQGDPLGYVWGTTGGTLEGSGAAITFRPVRVLTPTTYRISVQIDDGNGGAATGFIDLTVTPSGAPLNLAGTGAATASSANTSRGQGAAKAIDGVIGGFPGDGTKEWASVNQLVGAWFQLTWPSPQPVHRVVLHDRINTTDQILGGILRFSDGFSIPFGTLPNDGAGLQVNFAARSVTWVRMEVTAARGGAVGLAEFEIFAPPPAGSNGAPQITSGPSATSTTITDIETTTITVAASDPEGDALGYGWQTSGGTLIGTGTTVTFKPVRSTTTVTYRVQVEVFDTNGGAATNFVDITVLPSGAPINLAEFATATASTQATGQGQTAAKAIDGIVSGYPVDSTKEWASSGQLAGAWLQVTWSTAQTVSRIELHDRINLSDQILTATLRFSDGSTIAVGTLPNDGTVLPIDFSARAVTWVRLEITSARGWSTGLAEIKVF